MPTNPFCRTMLSNCVDGLTRQCRVQKSRGASVKRTSVRLRRQRRDCTVRLPSIFWPSLFSSSMVYAIMLEHMACSRRDNLSARTNVHRDVWVSGLLDREVVDMQIVASLQYGTAFFASSLCA